MGPPAKEKAAEWNGINDRKRTFSSRFHQILLIVKKQGIFGGGGGAGNNTSGYIWLRQLYFSLFTVPVAKKN